MTSRRDFVRTTATAFAAATLPRVAPGLTADKLERIGVQLYTVRSEMRKDFEGTLAKVAGIGYQEVEFAGYFDRSAQQVRNVLATLGLDSPAGHMPYEALRDERSWSETLEKANGIGHKYAIIAWTPQEDRRTLDDWKRIAEKFNRAGRAAKEAGLGFAYHNHEFEFKQLEGQVPFNLLLAETDPELVKIEMDLYWTVLGGAEPLDYFQRFPGRFPAVHVKDMKRGAEGPLMTDVGQGDINFSPFFRRREQAGIRHFFVEHDEPVNPIASIEAGYRYLRRLEF
jgi:sugar phosphate isomerase/epimerase